MSTFEKDVCQTSVATIVEELKTKAVDRTKDDFETFYRRYRSDLEAFTTCVGMTDYLRADVIDTLYDYGFDDVAPETAIFSVPWDDLIHRLRQRLHRTRIKCDCEVQDVRCQERTVHVRYHRYRASKALIFAVTIDVLRPWIQHHMEHSVLSHALENIEGQSFLRAYGHFADSFHLGNAMLRLGSPYQKLVPVKERKGLYMIAYSDNHDADWLAAHPEEFWSFYASTYQKTLLDVLMFYHRVGTHYYRPLLSEYPSRKAFRTYVQHPMPRVWIIGEMIALHQGWTEGALQTVDDIIPSLVRSIIA